MSPVNRVAPVCVTLFALVALTGASFAEDGVQHVSSVLATNFETVFYTRTDLISSAGSYRGLSKRAADSLRAPFAFLTSGVDSLGKNNLTSLLSNVDATWVGAEDFRGGWPTLCTTSTVGAPSFRAFCERVGTDEVCVKRFLRRPRHEPVIKCRR